MKCGRRRQSSVREIRHASLYIDLLYCTIAKQRDRDSYHLTSSFLKIIDNQLALQTEWSVDACGGFAMMIREEDGDVR